MTEVFALVEYTVVERFAGALLYQFLDGFSIPHSKGSIWLQVFQRHREHGVTLRLQGTQHVFEALGWKQVCPKVFGARHNVKFALELPWNRLLAHDEGGYVTIGSLFE